MAGRLIASMKWGVDVQEDLGRNLTYGLADILGRAIVVGDYSNQPFPSEAVIARDHGVSRSVTREAMKMLAAKGLLGARPKQGTFLRPQESWNLFDTDVLRWLLDRKVPIDLLRQFNELRLAVEPEAAALAATRATSSQQEAIAAALQKMRDAEGGQGNTLEADITFHVSILRASGNPFYIQFRDMVTTTLRTSIRFTNRIAGRSASIPEHSAVHQAIVANDCDAARTAMRKLISNALALIEQVDEEVEIE